MDYRLYLLDEHGRIFRVQPLTAADDAEALRLAQPYREESAIELWQGGRYIDLDPPGEG